MKLKFVLALITGGILASCAETTANAGLTPNSENSNECVEPSSVQIVDRLLRFPLGTAHQDAEDLMQRQSDQGYVAFPDLPGDRGTMTWTENRNGRTIEVRVGFQNSKASDRSVATVEESGGEELFCSWTVN